MQTYAGESRRNGYDARHKKNGSKSRRCTLPRENITQAQWKGLNSKVVMHNIRRPIRYELFRGLDEESQREYLWYLTTQYNATAGNIAGMLGVSALTVGRIIKALGCQEYFCKGRRMSASQREAWQRFLDGPQGERTPPAPPTSGSAAVTPPVRVEVELGRDKPSSGFVSTGGLESAMRLRPAPHARKLNVVFDGPISPEELAAALHAMLPDGAEVSRLEISCEL